MIFCIFAKRWIIKWSYRHFIEANDNINNNLEFVEDNQALANILLILKLGKFVNGINPSIIDMIAFFIC